MDDLYQVFIRGSNFCQLKSIYEAMFNEHEIRIIFIILFKIR